MTQQVYDLQFSRDPLQRSELMTMAWKEGERLGDRFTIGLMKSNMHFRSKELNKRSAFPTDEVGKSQIDAFNRPERVYLDRPLSRFVLKTTTTPLDYCITNEFLSSLSECERNILNDLSAGYTFKEIKHQHNLDNTHLKSLRNILAEKAVVYL